MPTGRNPVPAWAISPFEQFMEQLIRMNQMVHLTMHAISAVQGFPKLAEEIHKTATILEVESTPPDISQLQEEADLAREEVDSEFPLVHANAVINLWSLLEGLFRTFIVEFLKNEPSAYQIKEIQGLKIGFGEYESLSEEEKYYYIAEMLEKECAAPLKLGTDRFESILRPFSLSGDVPGEISKGIWELGQVRNALVHRAGMADRRLIAACPWLNLNFGQEIKITHKAFIEYNKHIDNYIALVVRRITSILRVSQSGCTVDADV